MQCSSGEYRLICSWILSRSIVVTIVPNLMQHLRVLKIHWTLIYYHDTNRPVCDLLTKLAKWLRESAFYTAKYHSFYSTTEMLCWPRHANYTENYFSRFTSTLSMCVYMSRIVSIQRQESTSVRLRTQQTALWRSVGMKQGQRHTIVLKATRSPSHLQPTESQSMIWLPDHATRSLCGLLVLRGLSVTTLPALIPLVSTARDFSWYLYKLRIHVRSSRIITRVTRQKWIRK